MANVCPTCGHESKGPPRSLASALTQSRLKELLVYDPETGIFTWKVKRQRASIGDVATGPDGQGYLRVTLGNERHRAHRLAWLYMHGRWPVDCIDHINLNGLDNRITNLREATKSQNGINRNVRRDNKTGLKGVIFARNRYVARIRVNGKTRHIGAYKNPTHAAFAYRIAEALVYGEFSRT